MHKNVSYGMAKWWGNAGKEEEEMQLNPTGLMNEKQKQKQHTGQNWKTMYGWGKDKFPFRKRKGCDPQKSKPSKLWREVGGKEEDSSHFGNNASRVEASWKMPCGGGGFIPILEKFAPILDFTEKKGPRKIWGRPQNIFGTNIEEREREGQSGNWKKNEEAKEFLEAVCGNWKNIWGGSKKGCWFAYWMIGRREKQSKEKGRGVEKPRVQILNKHLPP
jgi:hypothetical protein